MGRVEAPPPYRIGSMTDLKPPVLFLFRRLVREHADCYAEAFELEQRQKKQKTGDATTTDNTATSSPASTTTATTFTPTEDVVSRVYDSLLEIRHPHEPHLLPPAHLTRERFEPLIRSWLDYWMEIRKNTDAEATAE